MNDYTIRIPATIDAYYVDQLVANYRNPEAGVHLEVVEDRIRLVVNGDDDVATGRANEIMQQIKVTFWNMRADRLIRQNLEGTGFTYGYIGNVSRDRDDRSWFISKPHPGRAGTSADQVGGSYSTAERAKLAPIACAIRAGFDAK